jgi:predicted AAA+ superfamily ATPase
MTDKNIKDTTINDVLADASETLDAVEERVDHIVDETKQKATEFSVNHKILLGGILALGSSVLVQALIEKFRKPKLVVVVAEDPEADAAAASPIVE